MKGTAKFEKNTLTLSWLWDGKLKYTSLQKGLIKGRKRGWCQCEECGIVMSFSDKDIVQEHISGKSCPANK